MPPRNATNATKSKKSKRSAAQRSPSPSPPPVEPPTQLPTPLPDPPLASTNTSDPSPSLIDLDAGTPPPPEGYSQDQGEEDPYEPCSPPFREVYLELPAEQEYDGGEGRFGGVEGSPPPLPVPPRRGSVRRERDRDRDLERSSTSTANTSPSASGTLDSGSLSRTIRGYPYAPRGAGTTSPPSVSRPVVSGMSVGRALFGEQRGYESQQQPPQASTATYDHAYGQPVAPQRQYPSQPQPRSYPQQEYHESPFEMDLEHEPSYQPQPGFYAQHGHQHQHHQSQAHRTSANTISMPRSTPSMTSAVPVPVPMRTPISPIPASISPSSPPGYASTSPIASHPASGLAQAMRRGAVSAAASVTSHVRSASQSHSRSPVPEGKHEAVVSWSRWDVLDGKRVLIVAYGGTSSTSLASQGDSTPPSGLSAESGARLQMWDTSNLSSVTELLDITLDKGELGMALGGGSTSANADVRVRIAHAAVLQEIKASKKGNGAFEGLWPLLGILTETADEDELELEEPRSMLIIYSLRTHSVVKLLPFAGRAHMFVPGAEVVVVSTALPPTIHILSARTFHSLYTIGASALEAHAPPPASPGTVTSYSPAINSTINSLNAIVPSSAISISHAISQSASTHIHNIHNTVSGSGSSSSKSVSSPVPGFLSIEETTSQDSASSAYHGNTRLNTNISGANASSAHSGSGGNSPVEQRPAPAHPVFALHGRLLAYASPSAASQQSSPSLLAAASSATSKAAKRLSSSSTGSQVSSPSLSSSPFGLNKLTNITQADVGNAALKVGGSVFSGMKFLGGKAFEAAKSRVGTASSPAPPGPEGRQGAYPSTTGGISRSAPDDYGVEEVRERLRRERRYSNTSNATSTWQGDGGLEACAAGAPHLAGVAPHTRNVAEHGHYVTVLDLAGFVAAERSGGGGRSEKGASARAPRKVDEFLVSRSQRVVELRFSGDGTSVAAVLKDGHTVRTFKLHPMPAVVIAARSHNATTGSNDDTDGAANEAAARRASHVYNLHRGRTGAVVEATEWSKDGRWVGIATRNRTIHVFGVNPYGGKTDIRSHVEGKVRNVEVTEYPLTMLGAVARLRGLKNVSTSGSAPLAFTFLTPFDLVSSPELQFPFTTPSINITNSPTFSPPKRKRGTNYQDVLVFDPADGVLSLRRLTLEKRAVRDQSVVQAVTSISLPGMGGAGVLSSSPSTRATTGTKPVEPQMELIARENVQATWLLRREWPGQDITIPLEVARRSALERRSHSFGSDWLAQGEITTCSSSTRIVPRSLYLSHQFSFHSLGEDYHALIRRYQFDIAGAIIEVRKAVEISAYSSGGGQSSFVEGFSSPRDIRRASSSFDEPIASAISGSLDSTNLPAILPMYPNGIPGTTKPKSLRSSVPIRTMAGIGDGVSEGLGRLRREMTKARSPQLMPRSDSNSSGYVPLEFDEEDEDFLPHDGASVDDHPFSVSHNTSRDDTNTTSGLMPPLTNATQQLLDADVVGTMEDDIGFTGWDPQDRQAIEEAEQYDDITAVGFVDDEPKYQPPVDIPVATRRKSRPKRR